MAFEWHNHHFINGVACLDFANTVVYRNRPERREDRLKSHADLAAWFRAAGLPWRGRASLKQAIALRETIDSLFRDMATARPSPGKDWASLVERYRTLLDRKAMILTPQGLAPTTANAKPLAQIAHSALALALSPTVSRVKVCGGCGWLFIDRTRNRSKRWCITAMCGSRAKARRYYARKTGRLVQS
ncbi:MAG: CGNR zinc finger domain-containing protein [Hyphomicrobiales bacterium]